MNIFDTQSPRLIFTCNRLNDCVFVDVGRELSLRLEKEDIHSPSLPSLAIQILNQIVEDGIQICSNGIKYLALDNISILFEPELKFNVQNYINNIRRGIVLIIRTDNPVEMGNFYPFKDNKEISLSFVGESYQQIGFTNEQ